MLSQRGGSTFFEDDEDEDREDCDDHSLPKSGVSDDARCNSPSGKSVKSMHSVFGGGNELEASRAPTIKDRYYDLKSKRESDRPCGR